MPLKRKIQNYFAEWKHQKNHNPLIVRGCRQCGKTYSVLQFAKSNYKNVVYINFFENPSYSEIFAGSLDVDTITMYMTALLGPEVKFEQGNTCIVLDEIQECPKARSALKFLKLDGRYDVICTGSLLGISGYRDDASSIPVGYETNVQMYPLDFEEFLWANGISEKIVANLKNYLLHLIPVPQVLHNRLRDLLLQYIVVGGMPAVVNEFIDTKQLNIVLQMQRDIVNGYRDDMMKYANASDKSKIRSCFDSIPYQLGKENKKFQYSLISKGAKSKDYAGSLQWIEDAGIVKRCLNLNITELPLSGNVEKGVFKVYMCDIGLFVSMLEEGTQRSIIHGSLYGYKGAVFENLVADFFVKSGMNLYYFRKDSGLEVDFVTRIGEDCVLVECKASTGNIKSTKTILKHPEKYHVRYAVKLGDYNVGYSANILTLPSYMGFLIPTLTEFPHSDNPESGE